MCAMPTRRATRLYQTMANNPPRCTCNKSRACHAWCVYSPRNTLFPVIVMATSSMSAPATTATSRAVPARWTDLALLALRLVVGLMYACHGGQKLFGWFGGPGGNGGSVPLFSLFGFASVLELVGGLLIAVGLSTRAVAFVLAGQMAVAYFMVHAPAVAHDSAAIFPIVNRGEPAVLYCFIFLTLWAIGPGAYSLDGRRGLVRSV